MVLSSIKSWIVRGLGIGGAEVKDGDGDGEDGGGCLGVKVVEDEAVPVIRSAVTAAFTEREVRLTEARG